MRKGLFLTTNDLPEPAKVEPEKLNHITTAIIPDAVPQPEPKGDGFKKMITTHDESPDFDRDIDDMSKIGPVAESKKKPGRPKKD
jgi:hypothetical protein